jgi:polyhydroxybutyrate depolymerase
MGAMGYPGRVLLRWSPVAGLLLGAVSLATGCKSADTSPTYPARPADPTVTACGLADDVCASADGPSMMARTYDITVPPNYDKSTPAPLFLELHGFLSIAGDPTPWLTEESYNHFAPEAASRGILFVLPHGNEDTTLGDYFWNATDSCCDFEDTGVNDIGYLMAVIADVQSKYNVDPKQIYAFGHSNGGFMVNRMACDQADKIAGIVSLAGETYLDQTKCAASAPIAFLQVQGTADTTVPFGGGPPFNIAGIPPAPGAVVTAQDWAAKNDCNPTPDTAEPMITLMTASTSPDTTKTVYDNGCEGNGQTELWVLANGPHSPSFTAAWAPAVFDFLMAHPKP